ncbi:MAG: hypothetical protein UV39_C0004G0013 [Candidatus Azambacteria bacterium GW2011_GWA2_42_62]|nr:MAG: hypothetical protein UV39_C0004G0013 [Candidatus Azambacteria bacterium GW2011_GWA2_42_62]
MFDLTGKVALVTGARRGMGKSHALVLARQGAKVAVTDISQEECQLVVDEIKTAGGEAAAFKMDVSSKADVDAVFDAVIKQFGRLDILVNNAGIFAPKPALEITEEDWDKTININLKGEHYTASKGGIIGMTETLAIELASLGINVNAIAPGAIDAPMLQSGAETEELKKYTERIPLKRIGKPEEVSAAVIFLASEEASYITGTTIYVDGGWLSQ